MSFYNVAQWLSRICKVTLMTATALTYQNCGESYLSVKHISQSELPSLPADVPSTQEPQAPQPPLPTPPQPAYVPNRFVTATASGNGDGSSASPWTLAQAMQLAQPGNIVQVGPGIYNGNYKPNWREPTFSPANSGTANAKIVFFAQYPAAYYYQQLASVSQVRNNGTYVQDLGTGAACPNGTVNNDCGSSAIGCFERNHIVWDGFFADERYIAWAGDGGPVASNGSVGCEFRRNYIKMREQLTHREALPDGSFLLARTNHRGILVERSDGTKIFDNVIEGEGYRTGEPDIRTYNGESAVVLYDSKNFEVANNIFRNLKHAFYPKGIHENAPALVPGSFHHNRVENCEIAHELNALASPGTTALENEFFDIFQNIYVNNSQIFNIRPVGANVGPQQWRFVNNTVYNSQPGFRIVGFNAFSTVAGEQSIYRNNIFVGLGTAWDIYQGDYASSFGRADINYNRYFTVNSFFTVGNLSFANWQALGSDSNSTVGDPLFVNVGAQNFKLQPTSPILRGQASSGYDILNLQGEGTSARINLGAFISPLQNEVIGVRAP